VCGPGLNASQPETTAVPVSDSAVLLRSTQTAVNNTELFTDTGAAAELIGASEAAGGVPQPSEAAAAPAPAEVAVSRVVKRCIDIGLSVIGLVVLLPILVLIGLLVLLTDGRPIFFNWDVIGKNGRPFRGYKFRTMVADAEALREKLAAQNEMRGPVFKMRNDPRVTRVGAVLRRFSLDELPQLWSVLKGDMSLVGPRPLGHGEYAQATPYQRQKLSVIPGITCLWQVMGRNRISDFDEWVALDLEYIEQWSILLDLKILARTIPAVLRRRGAW